MGGNVSHAARARDVPDVEALPEPKVIFDRTVSTRVYDSTYCPEVEISRRWYDHVGGDNSYGNWTPLYEIVRAALADDTIRSQLLRIYETYEHTKRVGEEKMQEVTAEVLRQLNGARIDARVRTFLRQPTREQTQFLFVARLEGNGISKAFGDYMYARSRCQECSSSSRPLTRSICNDNNHRQCCGDCFDRKGATSELSVPKLGLFRLTRTCHRWDCLRPQQPTDVPATTLWAPDVCTRCRRFMSRFVRQTEGCRCEGPPSRWAVDALRLVVWNV
jgi:hypothetical protein